MTVLEVCCISLNSAFSYTAFPQIFTHEQPYNNIKHTTEVVIRSAKGEKPLRPTEDKVIQRGLDDDMWALLCLCWAIEPSQRPSIQQVLECFPFASSTLGSKDKSIPSILTSTGHSASIAEAGALKGNGGEAEIDSRSSTSESKNEVTLPETRETGTFVIYSPNGQGPKCVFCKAETRPLYNDPFRAAADSFTINDLAWTKAILTRGDA
jgi:hypothetical protein